MLSTRAFWHQGSVSRPWVKREVQSALEEEQKLGKTILFPIRLDDGVMESLDDAALNPNGDWATTLQQRFIGDFSAWETAADYTQAFDRLLRDLKPEDSDED